MNILLPALFGLHCILGPQDIPPNIVLMENLADYAKIDIWSMVPSLVDELGETPEVLSKFKTSKFICASGGKLVGSMRNRTSTEISQVLLARSVPVKSMM
jgi:hypothetical protein